MNAFAREHALPVLCGATTASEIVQAREQGAAFIKLFPAGPLGPAYLRAPSLDAVTALAHELVDLLSTTREARW